MYHEASVIPIQKFMSCRGVTATRTTIGMEEFPYWRPPDMGCIPPPAQVIHLDAKLRTESDAALWEAEGFS